jgi:hypothetical protein
VRSLKWYSIGAFSFPSTWGALIVSFIITGLFLRLYYGRNQYEWFGNSVFWFIVTWKFSVILFDFTGVLDQPLSVLYFNGGWKGFWLAVAVSLVYIYFKGDKKHLISAWFLVVLVYEGAAEFLADSASLLSAVNILVGFGLFYLLLKKGKTEIVLLLFTGIQILLNFIQGHPISTESAAYMLVTTSVLIMNRVGRDFNE